MRGDRPSSPPSWRGRAILLSVGVHGLALAATYLSVGRPAGTPDLEFCVEIAGADRDADAVETPEAAAEPDAPLLEPPPEEAPPVPEEEVAEELPDLAAEAVEPPPPSLETLGPPPVEARVRPRRAPVEPTRVAATPPPPAPTPVAASPPPSAASRAGAATVERAAPHGSNRRPAYPPESRRLGEQGVVSLRLALDATGRVIDVVVVESSGSPRLDEAARAAAWGWTFRPRREDGFAVPSSVVQRVVFSLTQA